MNAETAQASSDLVRPLHSQLTQLCLKSPLKGTTEVLDRAATLSLTKTSNISRVQTERTVLARRIALGERKFDDATVRESEATRVWHAGPDRLTQEPSSAAATYCQSLVVPLGKLQPLLCFGSPILDGHHAEAGKSPLGAEDPNRVQRRPHVRMCGTGSET
jgi:hypothetical protein